MNETDLRELPAISIAALERAEKASPTGRRCLIENLDVQNEWVVEVAHVLPREMSLGTARMRSIEWAWNMRKGTLNLDTHNNVFFLSPTMHALYKGNQWALLPAEDVVNRFFIEGSTFPVGRQDFPKFSQTVFHYTLLPLSHALSKSVITRKSDGGDYEGAFTTHEYPFLTLPRLASHIRPEFVLLHLALLLQGELVDGFIKGLVRREPLLERIVALSYSWHSPQLPLDARDDPSFMSWPRSGSEDSDDFVEWDRFNGEESEIEYDLEDKYSNGDSVATPPRRIRYRIRSQIILEPQSQYTQRADGQLGESGGSQNSDEGGNGERGRGRESEISGDGGYSSDGGWTKQDICGWARECSLTSAEYFI